jgi:ribosomal protein S24E
MLFITSLMDECVKSEDVVQLYKHCSSKVKQLEYIDKPHNSARDRTTVDLAISFLHKNLTERSRKKKQMNVFIKNNKDLTGSNMADLIVKAEKEKDQMRRMKSEHNLDRSTKENRNKLNLHFKTELTSTLSVTLNDKSKLKISPDKSKRRLEKRKAIKFSLAHI